MQSSAEANALRTLRCRREHGERIRRDRELLEEMVVDNRIHVEAASIGVLDLPHDFPGQVIMRLAGRCLHLAINSESHIVLRAEFRLRWTLA